MQLSKQDLQRLIICTYRAVDSLCHLTETEGRPFSKKEDTERVELIKLRQRLEREYSTA
jgi:hypothetical protein